jgi:hypothetical protein
MPITIHALITIGKLLLSFCKNWKTRVLSSFSQDKWPDEPVAVDSSKGTKDGSFAVEPHCHKGDTHQKQHRRVENVERINQAFQ